VALKKKLLLGVSFQIGLMLFLVSPFKSILGAKGSSLSCNRIFVGQGIKCYDGLFVSCFILVG
jgi:hypothetical protein